MSKMAELDLVVKEIRNAAQALLSAADSIAAAFGGPAEPEPKLITLEDVRAVLAEKSRAGFTAEIHELVTRHGADKLSAIDPGEYPALLQEAEGIGNG